MSGGLYIHIPYCEKKCAYCDFYSAGGSKEVSSRYVDRVKREIRSAADFERRTVYFGGGTPSLLSPWQTADILSRANILPGAEITLEANPDTLTMQKLEGYLSAGVNRLSIGVQSAYDSSLRALGRIHDSKKAFEAFKMAKKAGFTNISGDLMLGLGGYSPAELNDTIDFLKSRGAVHISAYMLKIEKGTPFYKNPPKDLPDEDEMADFYLAACQKLEKEGYRQYEISNFALKGFESRHNSGYWQLRDYLGIGPSAHSCIAGQRFYYPPDTAAFIAGRRPVADGNVDADDFIMLSLRLKSGLSLQTLADQWHLGINAHMANKLKIYEKKRLLTVKNNIISLTPTGFLAQNTIAAEIMSRTVNLTRSENII